MSNSTIVKGRPLISVVVEGYNDSLSPGSVVDTMAALTKQDFPLEQVEVVLVGSEAQSQGWKTLYSKGSSFFAVKTVGADGAHYYELKNKGARVALGEIIAFTDSDTCPESSWLSSIVRGIRDGGDVVAGLSLFRSEGGWGPDRAVMQAAASISWGFIVGNIVGNQTVLAKGFLSHNVGFRSDIFCLHQYKSDLGRTCAGSFLYKALTEAGARILLQPQQRVVHNFSMYWWVLRLHVRFGYEIFLLRRLDQDYPNRWVIKTKILEPLVTMVWRVLLDIPQWFRFSRLLEISLGRRLALLPVVIVMSTAAHCSEMVGMYFTLFVPTTMKRFAESV